MPLLRSLILGVKLDTTTVAPDVKKLAKELQGLHDITPKLANNLARVETELKKQVATHGMNNAQLTQFKLKQAGATDASLKNITALQSQLSAMQKHVPVMDKMRSGLASVAKGAAIFTGAVVAAGAGLAAFLAANLKSVDDLADSASRVGLSIEAYTRLRAAFLFTGSEAESVDGVIQKMNIHLAEAATKGGPAADTLRHMGLDAKNLIGLKPQNALYQIVDGLTAIQSPALRAQSALALFGKGSATSMNSLSAGSAELKKWAQAADRMGLTITSSMAQMAGDANDSIDQISGLFGGLTKRIAVGFAPVIITLGNSMLDWATKNIEGGKLTEQVLDAVGDTIKFVGDTWTWMVTGWKLGSAVVVDLAGQIISVISIIPSAIDDITQATLGWSSGIGQLIRLFGGEYQTIAQKYFKEAGDAWDQDIGTKGKDAFDKLRSSIPPVKSAIGGVSAAVEALAESFSDLKKSLEDKISAHGLDDFEVKLKALKEGGASPSQIGELQGLHDKDLANGMKDNPLSKFAKSSATINRLEAGGNLNKDQANDARNAAKQEAGGGAVGMSAKFTEEWSKASQQLHAGVITMDDYRLKMRELKESVGVVISPFAKLATQTEGLDSLLKKGQITQTEYNDSVKAAKDTALGGVKDLISTPMAGVKEQLDLLARALKAGAINATQSAVASKKLAKGAFPDLEKLETPIMKLRDYVNELKEGVEGGVINKGQAGDLLSMKQKELTGAGGNGGPTAAMQMGSKEAYSAILKAQTGGKNNDQAQIAKNTAGSLQAQRELNRILPTLVGRPQQGGNFN